MGTNMPMMPEPKISLADAEERQVQLVEQRCRELGADANLTVEGCLELVDIRNHIAQGLSQHGSYQQARQLLAANEAMTMHRLEDPDLNARRLNLRTQVFNVMTCLCKRRLWRSVVCFVQPRGHSWSIEGKQSGTADHVAFGAV
eukprot:GGOE01021379.1.p3 GENE.GGOE01021379.1~~GGOE01021379.1.p3  ORF type:complete len:144 (+),score=27.97 GGOE01021379.1:54-485(+)